MGAIPQEDLVNEIEDKLWAFAARAREGSATPDMVRAHAAALCSRIGDNERSAICDDMARWSRDNVNVGRPTRAAWFLQVADRIRNRRD